MTTAITVSERAARRIGEILKGEGDGAMLRISVEGGPLADGDGSGHDSLSPASSYPIHLVWRIRHS